MSFVVDASIVIRLLSSLHVDELLLRRMVPPRTAHAPQLIDAEVASGVRGLLLGKKIEPSRAEQMLSDFAAMRIVRYQMRPYLHRVLALRDNFTAYDAFYVALAEHLELPLLTGDATFERASGHAATVRYYP